MSINRVLILDADWLIAEALSTTFRKAGFEVERAMCAEEGVAVARRFRPSLVVADLDLLAANGFEFCWKLRNGTITNEIRILMLSNGSDFERELLGLARGADDYLLKPFDFRHLMHRVGILLRRKSVHEESHRPIRHDGLELDFDQRTAWLNGINLELTATQFRILWALTQRPGCVLERFQLVTRSRGKDANSSDRAIDVHIKSIRRKLGNSGRLIETVRGIGYRFRDPAITPKLDDRDNQDFELSDDFASSSTAFSDSATNCRVSGSDRSGARSMLAKSVIGVE